MYKNLPKKIIKMDLGHLAMKKDKWNLLKMVKISIQL